MPHITVDSSLLSIVLACDSNWLIFCVLFILLITYLIFLCVCSVYRDYTGSHYITIHHCLFH
jgi:hypothetical protein